jgi:hypothetical protein
MCADPNIFAYYIKPAIYSLSVLTIKPFVFVLKLEYLLALIATNITIIETSACATTKSGKV